MKTTERAYLHVMSLLRNFIAPALGIAALTCCGTAPSLAAMAPVVPGPAHVNARSYVLEDAQSGRIVASFQPDLRLEPGSLAKLMTLYIVFGDLASGRLHLGDKVHIGKKVWQMKGAQMFLRIGTEVPVQMLIRGMVVDSANDAALALAKQIAGSQQAFVVYMNQDAHTLGLKDTHFTNATGLPVAGEATSARDMAKLARILITKYPQYYSFFSLKTLTFDKIKQYNRNMLLYRDEGVDGLKTGSTDAAGYHLVASAVHHGDRIITAVMGAPANRDLTHATMGLIDYYYRFYKTVAFYKPGTPLRTARVWKGDREKLPLGVAKPLYVTYPKVERGRLKADMDLPDYLVAPVVAGQPVGTAAVSLNRKVIARAPIVALHAVPLGGMWTRVTDGVDMLVQRKFQQWFPQLSQALAAN